MTSTLDLPLPRLHEGRFASSNLRVFTDEALYDATGVRVAFSQRTGGFSAKPYASLNLGSHVGDHSSTVDRNRHELLESLQGPTDAYLVPNQVHGSTVLPVGSSSDLQDCARKAAEGADALVVSRTNFAAMLCYADCVPVILASPSGIFAVVHAGWKGVMSRIAVKALAAMDCSASSCNAYIGPYIHAECFEVSPDLAQRFADEFGVDCRPDRRHVDLGCALRSSLTAAGIRPQRIADVNCCTACDTTRFFSYRAEGGTTGRHAAVAFRS